jgi:hypothetical protein
MSSRSSPPRKAWIETDLGGVESGVVAGAAAGRHPFGELFTGQGMVVGSHPLKGLISDLGSISQAYGGAEPAVAGAFDFHALGIVVGLAEVFAEGFAEGLAGADRQHPPPPETNP